MTPEQYDEHVAFLRNLVQWSHRAGYEEAWRKAGGDPERSNHNDEPVGWRAEWMKSETRAVLIRNGLLTGEDRYK